MSDSVIKVDKVAMPNRIEEIKTQRGDSADVATNFRSLTIGDRTHGPNGEQMRNIKSLMEEILILQQDIMELTAERMQKIYDDFINKDENGG